MANALRSRPSRPSGRKALAAAAVLLLAAAFTPPGEHVLGMCHRFLDFYAGVFCLVALSITVMAGLAATDRLVLLVRHRVLLQAAHRSTATAAVAFLFCHVVVKVMEAHVGILDVVLPFLASRHTAVIGLGTLAGYGLAIAAWTGAVRGRFADFAHPWVWRAVHSCAYAAWPMAIVHGLTSGRSPATWVTVSYVVCVLLVGAGLAVRLSVRWGRRLRTTPKAQTTGSLPRIPVEVPLPPPVQRRTVREPVPLAPLTTVRRPASSPLASPPPKNPPPARPPASAAPVSPPAAPVIPAQPRKAFETVSDDEYWAVLRGEDLS
ncbi:hypothetical protein HDA40_002818 [Hamadaea flava]|uniref:DMSO/TMAO reductase YedYZ heme-binding membrane subunit n=1 Tax=Hamadaea flava TaxID=1742688 RepID=A0ABV8LGI7_9ACTN|nr:hypothetical protein [Hamadaea flava]MCP2324311.1 hypothetical protein [Hamadaea flava]